MNAVFAAIGAALGTWALMTPGNQIGVAFGSGIILGHALIVGFSRGAK